MVKPKMVNEEKFFQCGVRRLFSGTTREMVGELLQNAQRAGARHLDIEFPTPTTCTFRDDGHGILHGVEGLKRLLVFSESCFANPDVALNQRPMGMGLYAVIVHEQVHHLLMESVAEDDPSVLVLGLDTAVWLDDSAYREGWRQRCFRERRNQVFPHGFRLTITGTEQLMREIRECLEKTAARKWAETPGWVGSMWLQEQMSPACGYADLLTVRIEGTVLDTRLPQRMLLTHAEINAWYQDNLIRISLTSSPEDWQSGLLVNWYGQLIFTPTPRGWTAYLHVRCGHPVTPKAPTREGLMKDAALQALYQWVEDQIFGWVGAKEHPSTAEVEKLYEINATRAEVECPFAVVQRWKPLPLDYTFTSYDAYRGQDDEPWFVWEEGEGKEEECDQFAAKQVVRKSDLEQLILLDEQVYCPLPANHPAQRWETIGQARKGELADDAIVVRTFEIGFNSLLRATGIEAYMAGVGVPAERIRAFWWQPGPPVDTIHTTTPGKWCIHPAPSREARQTSSLPMEWQPLARESLPVFVASDVESDDITYCQWVIALAETTAIVPFLQRYGRAAFICAEDDPDLSRAVYGASVNTLIRAYLGDTLDRGATLGELVTTLKKLLPSAYALEEATWKFQYQEDTKHLKALTLLFPDSYAKTFKFY